VAGEPCESRRIGEGYDAGNEDPGRESSGDDVKCFHGCFLIREPLKINPYIQIN